MTIDNQIHARLTQIIVTSLYEEVGGVCFLFESLDLTTPPWFWPEPGTISCRYPAATPNRRILPPKGVRAENLFGSRWNKVFDETENGSRIVIGRVPSWTEYWSGSPPEALAREITLKSVDEYLQTVFSGRETSPSTLFGSAQKAKMNTGLPDKPMFGSSLPDAGRFGFGEVSLGPNAQWPNAGGPLDPWPAYRRTGSIIDCWERICCIGLDNERLQATAVVDITQISGYGGPICQSRSFLSVGFWLVEPSVAELIPQSWRSNPDPNINDLKTEFEACSRDVRFLGSTRISVGDVPRQIRSLNCPDQQWVYDSSFLAYAASLQLTSEDLSYMEQCSESMRLPVLHCVIAFNQNLENSHFLGRGVHFGHFAQRVVQFPTLGACRKLKAGVETIKILDDVTQARPVHVANLPNGDILFFSGSIYGPRLNGESEGHHDPRNSVAIFRPSTNEIIPIEDPPFDIFCSGHSTLANGNVVIIGGTKERATQHQHAEHWPGLRDVTVFDWRSMKFSNLGYMMREGRWYPSTVVLGNGDVFVCDGHPTIDSIPHTNFDLEILSKDADRIVVQVENGNISAGSADPTLYYDESEFANPIRESFTPREVFQGLYPRLFLLPNGQLFSASSLRSLPILPKNGKNAEDERINKDILALEPSLMADKVTFNLEYRTYVGRRIFRDNSYVFQPRQPWENRQIYEAPVEAPDAHGPIWGFDEPAVLLPMTVSSDSENVRSQPRVLTFVNGRDCTIEPLALNPTWKHALRTRDESLDFTGTRRIDRKRRYGNLVLLPDGSVMVIGGSDDYYGAPLTDFEENRSVFEVEYFVPGERSDSDFWRTDRRARLAVPRRYHSTAILLLDGRVMVGGGNVSENYNKQVLKESSFRDIEIITPDYYENGPQPEFFIDNASVGYGDLIAITLREGTSVNNLSKFAMFIRCASFTHAFGYDQRAVQLLPYGPLTPTKYDVRIPNNSNIMPPGYYMLFIVSQSGVPSCGKMVMIGS